MPDLRLVESLRTEHSTLPEGLLTDPTVSGNAKAFMTFLGRHLRGSAYRVAGLPPQLEIGKRFFGWGKRTTNETVAELKAKMWLAITGDGYGRPRCYLFRSPQMALELAPKTAGSKRAMCPTGGADICPTGGADNITTPYRDNHVSLDTYDDETTDESSSSVLRNYGVTDAQIRTLRRGHDRDLSPARVHQEVAWIRAGKRTSEKVRTEPAMLYSVLRDRLDPPADVLAERAHAERLELDHNDLARRRADDAAAHTPEAIEASRTAREALKERLRKGTA